MCDLSVLGRARSNGLVDVRVHDLRMTTTDPHRSVDDAPFGGGPGMVLAPEPVFGAVEAVKPLRPLYLLDAGGQRFDQQMAARLAGVNGFSLLCGRYEGVDDRIRTDLVDGSISLGDFVLAGGEFAAMSVVEAVVRLLPGVLHNQDSIQDESFSDGLLEYPQWTRPAEFGGRTVPEILRSGDHERIARWRHAMALVRTAQQRPDLLFGRELTDYDQAVLDEFGLDLPERG